MGKDTIVIREIEPQDNAELEQIIRACFYEFKIPLEGTAYSDKETTKMFESYQNDNDVYYVVTKGGHVFGGIGVKPLGGGKSELCEIQKMYFSPEIRGEGIGKKIFKKALDFAKNRNYKQCYIESAPQLKAAIHIYENYGFKHLKKALGDTGHFSCGVWMIKNL